MKSTLHKKNDFTLKVNSIIFFLFFTIFCFGLNSENNKTEKNINIDEVPPPAVINCSSVDCIINAMTNAQPGDEIIIAPGTYTAPDKFNFGNKATRFGSDKNGTASLPIILRAQNPSNPPILKGPNGIYDGYVMFILGDHWRLKDLILEEGSKGLVMDNANNAIIENVVVRELGEEGIHLRDGSSNNLVKNCSVYNVGIKKPGIGEGLYVGSDKGQHESSSDAGNLFDNKYNPRCDNNTFEGCIIGPNVTAEGADIKEGTENTIIRNCTFSAQGLSGENSADAFIDLKGAYGFVYNNTFNRDGSNILASGVDFLDRGTGFNTGFRNAIFNNTFNLGSGGSQIPTARKKQGDPSEIHVWDNTRNPNSQDFPISDGTTNFVTLSCPSWNIISCSGSGGGGGGDGGGSDTDDIASVNAPSSVERGTTVPVTVNYSASTNRDVIVVFQLGQSPWTAYASQKIDVSAGSGTLTFNLDIPSNTPLGNGQYQFQTIITTNNGGWNDRLDNLAKANIDVVNGGGGSTQSPSKTLNIPGVVEAEDYDNGGQGIAYNDADASNNGSQYRNDGVDIENTSDSGGGHNVGWTQNGEWLEYTIGSTTSGNYNVSFRVASPNGNSKSIGVTFDGSNLGSVNVPNTGGWQNWQTVTLNNVNISGGNNKVLRLRINGGSFNINKATFTTVSTGGNNTPITIESVDAEQQPNVAENLLDGNTADNSRWSTQNFSKSVVFDLGSQKAITGFKLWSYQDRAYKYEVKISNSPNSGFNTRIVDRRNNTSASQPISNSFSAATARYVELTVTGAHNYGGSWVSITEVEIETSNSSRTGVVKPKDLVKNNTIKLYPNPVKNNLVISLNEIPKEASEVIFYNSLGRVIKSQKLNGKQNQLNINEFATGIYFAKVTNNGETKIIKLVKQ